MAKLTSFKIDSRARETGEWISPGDEFDDLEIHTRGLTDSYIDARAAKMRKASLAYGGDASKIPNAKVREIVVDCLLAHCTLDVRNLTDADGSPVTFEQFGALLRTGDYPDLIDAALRAATMVGQRKASDTADAAGN